MNGVKYSSVALHDDDDDRSGVASVAARSIALRRARCLLVATSACYGSYPVTLRCFYANRGADLPLSFVTTVRFAVIFGLISVLRAARWLGGSSRELEGDRIALRRAAAELALIDFTANWLSMWGISQTPAVASEVLMATVHLFVPMFSLCPPLVRWPQPIGKRTWCGCLLAFAAAAAVAVTGRDLSLADLAHRSQLRKLLPPGALVGAAACYALGRVRLMEHLRTSDDAERLVGLRVGWMLALSLVALFGDILAATGEAHGGAAALLDRVHAVRHQGWAFLLLSCAVSGLLGALCQFQAQRVSTAASAQPFLALQPLWAAVWAACLLREPLPHSLLLGGGAVICGALLAATERADRAHVERRASHGHVASPVRSAGLDT